MVAAFFHRKSVACYYGTGYQAAWGRSHLKSISNNNHADTVVTLDLVMAVESIGRFFRRLRSIMVSRCWSPGVGLVVNIACALLLHGSHGHGHNHGNHNHHHEDHNLKAAYFHVLADALTSVLAIVALLFGNMFGWWVLDPMMGIVGALVITRWAWGLLKESGAILLDASVDGVLRDKIRATIEAEDDNRIADLHIWKIGPHHLASIITLVTHYPKPTESYWRLLAKFDQLNHITIEVVKCEDYPCLILDEQVNRP